MLFASIAKATASTPATGSSSVLMIFPLLLFFMVIFIVGQYFVLKCKNKRLGLLLPSIWFAATLILLTVLSITSNHTFGFELILLLFTLNIPTGIMLLMMYIKNGKEKQSKSEFDTSKTNDLDK